MKTPGHARQLWMGRGDAQPFRFGLLLVDGFTLIGLGATVDPLRIANMVAGRRLYQFCTLSQDGGLVASSDGIRVQADFSLTACPVLDAVLVIGPNPIPTGGIDRILRWLSRQATSGVILGGVDTGSYFLARAGLLDGYRATIHWEDMHVLEERFPRLALSHALYEIDRDRCTCSGGVAPLEMMVHIISMGAGGRETAASMLELLVAEKRSPQQAQRTPLRGLEGAGHPRLVEAVTLMESNVEEPLSMDEIAAHLNISVRQLERLFRDELKATPSQYYLRVRLSRARHLLRRTRKPVSEIAVACGFVSQAHFSQRYHAAFGCPPRQERAGHAKPDGSTDDGKAP